MCLNRVFNVSRVSGRKPLTSTQRREGVKEAQEIYEQQLRRQQDDEDSGGDSTSYTRREASELFAQHVEQQEKGSGDCAANASATVFDPWASATPATACPPMPLVTPMVTQQLMQQYLLPFALTPEMMRQQQQLMQQHLLPFAVTPEMVRAQQARLEHFKDHSSLPK